MARDRQRAKQRQAERRARRLAQQGEGAAVPGDGAAAAPPEDAASARQAPPPESTRGDIPGVTGPVFEPEQVPDDRPLTEDEAPLSEDEALQEIEDWEVSGEEHLTEDEVDAELEAEEELAGRGEDGFEVRGRRGRDEADKHKHRPRVIQFLIAVWAELQRVQWPNRQAMITLTGVVLGFVLIAGGYLGLLDAVFSELIKAIL